MAANLTIPQHYPIQYDQTWSHLVQQHSNRLRSHVLVDTGVSGKVKTYNQLGTIELQEYTTRMATTVLDEIDTAKRWVRPKKFARAVGFDEWDDSLLGQIALPTSQTMQSLSYGAGRAMEQVLIDALGGTAFTGEDGTTSTTFGNGTTDQDVGSTSSNDGLTLAKLISAREILGKNEAFGQDVENSYGSLCLALSQKQISDLLAIDQLTSADYAQVKALVAGDINTFMGFTIVRTEQLPIDANDIRTCYAWAYQGVQMAVWSDPSMKLTIRDDLDEALQIRAKLMCGATRMEEEAVVRIYCDETPD